MPYDLQLKSGVILRNIPDELAPDSPEVAGLKQKFSTAGVKAETREDRAAKLKASNPGEYDPESPEWKKKYGATSGMSGTDKVLANLGAGFANLGQGVQQLFGGVSDEDVLDKRRIDQELADNTTGGGALQIAGEALPTLLIPGGGAARVAGAGLKRLGAEAAGKLLSRGTGNLVAGSALSGAAGGALGPVTDEESRLVNAGIGGAFGAAVPAAGRVVGSGYRALTKTGAAQRAARAVQEGATDSAAAQRRLAQYTGGPNDIPLTSAAAAEDAGLAGLEQGMRAKRGADFYEGDQDRARKVFEKVQASTDDASDLAKRRGDRRAEWDSNWKTAETVADPQVFAQEMDRFAPALQQALRSPEAANPAVRSLLREVASQIDEFGPDFSPAHLQQIRANLNGRGNPMSPNVYQAAPRESAAVQSLISEIDGILNRTTNDAWDAVKGGYAASSRGVDESKAAGRVRNSFVDEDTGRVRGTAADPQGDIPNITEAGLGRAMDTARGPDKSNLLSSRATAGLDQTLAALRKQGITQRVKRSATAGGGSDTVSNMMASGLADRLPGGGGIVRGAIDFGKDVANRKRDQALVNALRDPAEMQRLLQLAVRAPGDLTNTERAVLAFLRTNAATGAVDTMRQQQ